MAGVKRERRRRGKRAICDGNRAEHVHPVSETPSPRETIELRFGPARARHGGSTETNQLLATDRCRPARMAPRPAPERGARGSDRSAEFRGHARDQGGRADRAHVHTGSAAADHEPFRDASRLQERCAASEPGARSHRQDLLGQGAWPARRRGRPWVCGEPVHLPLLHVQEVRQLRLLERQRPGEQGLAVHPRRQRRRQPVERDGPDRQHPQSGRHPQRRRPQLRQGRQPLHKRRRRRLRLCGRQRLWKDERRGARSARPARQGASHHPRRRDSRHQPLPRHRQRALQRGRPDRRRQEMPGDVLLGAAKPVPGRLRPERHRHALLHQRRRPRDLGGDRPRAGRSRLRLERARRAVRHRLDHQLRAATRGHDQPDLFATRTRADARPRPRAPSSPLGSGRASSTAPTSMETSSAERSSGSRRYRAAASRRKTSSRASARTASRAWSSVRTAPPARSTT